MLGSIAQTTATLDDNERGPIRRYTRAGAWSSVLFHLHHSPSHSQSRSPHSHPLHTHRSLTTHALSPSRSPSPSRSRSPSSRPDRTEHADPPPLSPTIDTVRRILPRLPLLLPPTVADTSAPTPLGLLGPLTFLHHHLNQSSHNHIAIAIHSCPHHHTHQTYLYLSQPQHTRHRHHHAEECALGCDTAALCARWTKRTLGPSILHLHPQLLQLLRLPLSRPRRPRLQTLRRRAGSSQRTTVSMTALHRRPRARAKARPHSPHLQPPTTPRTIPPLQR